jgi:hypothetical protein
MTLSMATLGIMTLSIMSVILTLSLNDSQHNVTPGLHFKFYVDCRVFDYVRSVVMPNVVMPSVAAPISMVLLKTA